MRLSPSPPWASTCPTTRSAWWATGWNSTSTGARLYTGPPTHVSGEILQVTLYATETGTGAVLTPAGTLFLFDADPSISSGDTAMTLAARQTVIAQIPVSSGDWKSDANGASAAILDSPVAFHQVTALYFAWLHEEATSFNSAAGDDESLDFNFWFRRDS
jgi:hypothetical protein